MVWNRRLKLVVVTRPSAVVGTVCMFSFCEEQIANSGQLAGASREPRMSTCVVSFFGGNVAV